MTTTQCRFVPPTDQTSKSSEVLKGKAAKWKHRAVVFSQLCFVLFKALNLWLAISYSKTKSPTAAWVTQSDRVQPGINSACRQVRGENIFWNMLNFLILVCLRRLGSCQSNQPLSPGYFNTASSGEEKPQFLCTATRGWLQKRVSPHRHPTFGLCGLQWVLLQFQLQLTECKISIYWVLFSYPSQILSV